jgi:REP element-mobilizing transposase RayT
MVIAYHVVFSTYGFWLPSDPRGSGSDFVRSIDLLPYGLTTKVHDSRSVARKPHNVELRRLAKKALKSEPVIFNGRQALSVAKGFGKAIQKAGMVVLACAIMPDHVHLVILRHEYRIETLIRLLKSAATTQLIQDGLHPFQDVVLKDGSRPSPWGQKYRAVYIDEKAELPGRIKYVRENPLKEGKRVQLWSFVTPLAQTAG